MRSDVIECIKSYGHLRESNLNEASISTNTSPIDLFIELEPEFLAINQYLVERIGSLESWLTSSKYSSDNGLKSTESDTFNIFNNPNGEIAGLHIKYLSSITQPCSVLMNDFRAGQARSSRYIQSDIDNVNLINDSIIIDQDLHCETQSTKNELYNSDSNSIKLSAFEEQLVAAKQWHHLGEVKATDRPLNSLLNAEVDISLNKYAVSVSQRRQQNSDPEVLARITKFIESTISQKIVTKQFSDISFFNSLRLCDNDTVSDDENISVSQKKGVSLGELYESEYLRSLGSSLDESKKESEALVNAKHCFKELMLSLAVLSGATVAGAQSVHNGSVELAQVPVVVGSSLEANPVKRVKPIDMQSYDELNKTQRKILFKQRNIK